MTSRNLVTAREGITMTEAKKILAKARVEKLPIVDDDFNLKGLITIKDIEDVYKRQGVYHELRKEGCTGGGKLLPAPGTSEKWRYSLGFPDFCETITEWRLSPTQTFIFYNLFFADLFHNVAE